MKSPSQIRSISLAALILLIAPLPSCGKQEKMNVYSCKDKYSADSCKEGCELDKGMKFSFQVSKEERSVFQIVYLDGEQSGSITHKNCTIFSKESWDCSEEINANIVTLVKTNKMTNGIFTSYDTYAGIKGISVSTGTCAK